MSFIKENSVIHGDCSNELKKITDKSINLICIDPPYNINKDAWDDFGNVKKGYSKKKDETDTKYYLWLTEIFKEFDRIIKDNGSLWFFHNDFRVMSNLNNIMENNTSFCYRNFIIWNKLFENSKNKGFLNGYVQIEGLNNFQKMAEYILFYVKNNTWKLKEARDRLKVSSEIISKEILSKTGKTTGWYNNIETGKNYPTKKTIVPITKYLGLTLDDIVPKFRNQKTHHSVWNYEFDKNKTHGHITPKPVELIKNIILHCTDENDLVLDCFGGTGTTAVACLETNRKYIIIEKEKSFVDIIHNRINAYPPILE